MSKYNNQVHRIQKVVKELEDISLSLLPLHLENEKLNGIIDVIIHSCIAMLNRVAFYL